MKAVVAAFNQEKALVGAFSVITNIRMELFEALVHTGSPLPPGQPGGEGVHAGLPLLAAPRAQLGQAASAGRLVAGDQSQLSIESALTNQVAVSPVDTLPAPRRARAGHQVRALGLAAAAQPRPLVQRVDVEPGQETVDSGHGDYGGHKVDRWTW